MCLSTIRTRSLFAENLACATRLLVSHTSSIQLDWLRGRAMEMWMWIRYKGINHLLSFVSQFTPIWRISYIIEITFAYSLFRSRQSWAPQKHWPTTNYPPLLASFFQLAMQQQKTYQPYFRQKNSHDIVQFFQIVISFSKFVDE